MKGRKLSLTHRNKISDSLKNIVSSKSYKCEICNKKFNNPLSFGGHLIGAHKSEKHKESLRKFILKRGPQKSPNGGERKLLRILNNLHLREWKFVGNGRVILGGKNPDFINVNGKKLIIELFGKYWHTGENPKDREKIFVPFGYRTLVIWYSELRNEERVKNKIREFMN